MKINDENEDNKIESLWMKDLNKDNKITLNEICPKTIFALEKK